MDGIQLILAEIEKGWQEFIAENPEHNNQVAKAIYTYAFSSGASFGVTHTTNLFKGIQ